MTNLRLLAKLQSRSVIDNNGCWLWSGCVQENGYGRITIRYRTQYTHRVAFEAAGGVLVDGMDICHRCDIRRCCNPGHLFQGTRRDNVNDCVSKGRASKGYRHSILLRGELAGNSKLTWKQVKEIRRLKNRAGKGETNEIAKMFGVSSSTVRLIVQNRIWKESK
jgi:hypothetical protein